MKRTWYINFIRLLTVIILLTAGILIGGYMTESRIEKEQGSLYNTTKIAVVNLDEGVTYENEYRNFASEIVSSQDKDIIVTGLDDAKSGLKDGKYSAYIIMPSDFSQNTTTINTAPVKSLIKYEIGSNLSDAAKDRATVNVLEISKSINDDLGYVYLNSVFNSFHQGQNSALKVIGNDSRDKKVIMAISNIDLIESIDLTEVKRLENDVEKLDVSEDFETNQQIIEMIDLAYRSYLEKTSGEMNQIKSASENVKDLNNILNENINSIPTLESEGYQLLNTKGVLSDHSNDLNSFKIDTTNLLQSESSSSQNSMAAYKSKVEEFIKEVDSFNANLSQLNKYPEIKESLSNTTASLNISMFPALSDRLDLLIKENEKKDTTALIEEYITNALCSQFGNAATSDEALTKIFEEAENNKDVIGLVKKYAELNENSTMLTLEDYYRYTRKPNDSIQLPIFDEGTLKANIITDLKKDIPNIYKTVNDQLDEHDKNFPKIAIDTESITKETGNQENTTFDLTNIIEKITGISSIADSDIESSVSEDLNPLKIKQSSSKKSLIEKSEDNMRIENQFVESLNLFDPLKFIDEKEIQEYVNQYRSNSNSVENKIKSQDSEYKSFVDKSYEQANEHVDTIRQDIKKYKDLSDDKLSKGLQNAKKIKTETSNDNQEAMSNFINTLPYSRLGENENTQLYQFMVNPVLTEGKEAAASNLQKVPNYNQYIFTIMIITCILLISVSGIYFVRARKQKAQS